MKYKGIDIEGLTEEQAVQVLKRALSTSVVVSVKRKFDGLFDDQFNHYRHTWERVYKFHGQIVEKTDFGYRDPYGLTKYYSRLIPPWSVFEAGGCINKNGLVYIGEDDKVYPYPEEHKQEGGVESDD